MIIRNESMRMLLISLLVAESGGQCAAATAATMPILSVQEIALLAQFGKPELSVTFDTTSLQLALQSLRHVQNTEKQLGYFFTHGATNSMIADLFHLSANNAKVKRKAHESTKQSSSGQAIMPTEKRRRPSMPTIAARQSIHEKWCAVRSGRETNAPKALEFRTLHEAFPTLSLATLHAVISEFDD